MSCNSQRSLQTCLVIGNESCDLDSAVCAIGLAYHLTNHKPLTDVHATDYFIPVLNVPREKLSLKSEVVHYLRKNDIQTESVICRDEVNLSSFGSYVLVDHHASPFDVQKVKMVFDHRPRNRNIQFPPGCEVTIADVGSCATLISNYILQESANSTDDEKGVLKLLLGGCQTESTLQRQLKFLHFNIPLSSAGPIILDTINFSPEADKARPLDCEVLQKMEAILEIHDLFYRNQLFDELVAARSDVSELDSYQVLFKDMKAIGQTHIVAIPGYPIRVQEYVRMPAAENSVLRFAQELNCDVVVLMGMKLTGGKIQRDLAIVNVRNAPLFAECKRHLEGSLDFQFEQVGTFMGGPVYEQHNIKLSRKQILPILNKLVV